MPGRPTAVEGGLPDCTLESWYGLVGPVGTRTAIVHKMNVELIKAAISKDVVDAIEKVGCETSTSSTEEFGEMIKNEWPKWKAGVKASGASAR